MAAKQTGAKPRGGLAMILGPLIAFLPLAYLIWPSLLLCGVLMAPTVAAAVADRSRGRYLTYGVGLLNLACALPALLRLWGAGQETAMALALAADPGNWGLAYAGAALGWGIFLLLPPVVAGYYATRTRDRLVDLQKRRASLERDWGDEVSGSGS